jgi:transcriptional/translational regulatory protein YebC/TACO1
MVGHTKWSKIKRRHGALDQSAPKKSVNASSPAITAHLVRLIDALEDNDDVQNVHSNFDPTEIGLEKITG